MWVMSRRSSPGHHFFHTNAEMTLLSEADEIGYPVADNPTDEDIEYAQKAVVIHQGQDWPAGRQCINCRAPWPCALNRWGRNVLTAVGYVEADVAGMVCRARNGIVPWS
ncbi:MAG: hypothetical protein JWP76_1555 [Dactylosporangium sp.]|jgi:hypothetical protein|nr:hypothetical protein [Dactylosporangium sp.]